MVKDQMVQQAVIRVAKVVEDLVVPLVVVQVEDRTVEERLQGMQVVIFATQV